MKATFLSRGKAGPCEPQWAGTHCRNTCLVLSAGWSGETHVSPCVGNLNLFGGPWSGRPLLRWTSFFRWGQSGNVSQGSGARRGTARPAPLILAASDHSQHVFCRVHRVRRLLKRSNCPRLSRRHKIPLSACFSWTTSRVDHLYRHL